MKSVLLLNLLVTATSASMASDFAHHHQHKPRKNSGLRGERNLKGHKQQRASKPDKQRQPSIEPIVQGEEDVEQQQNSGRRFDGRQPHPRKKHANQQNNAVQGSESPTAPPIDDTDQLDNANTEQPQGREQHNPKKQRARNPRPNNMKQRNGHHNKRNKNTGDDNVEGGEQNGRGKNKNQADGGRFSKPEREPKHQRNQDVERTNPAPAVVSEPIVTSEPTLAPVTPAPTMAPVTPAPTMAPVTPEPTPDPTTYYPTSPYTSAFPTFTPTSTPTTRDAATLSAEDAELEAASEAPTESEPELETCPPAYDTARTDYVGGDLIGVKGHSFECHSIYSTYCNIAQWNDNLLEENENAKEFWNLAWTHLGPCAGPEEVAEEEVEEEEEVVAEEEVEEEEEVVEDEAVVRDDDSE